VLMRPRDNAATGWPRCRSNVVDADRRRCVKIARNMRITASPVAALRDYVRNFQQRQADVGGCAIIYPIAARPEQFLEFYLREPYLVRSCDSGLTRIAPPAVVVGPGTCRRVELVLQGRFDVFTIHFQPSGFHGLFGVPMWELADQAYEARAVIGPFISEVEQKLADASNFDERIRITTAFLLRYAASRVPDAVAAAANGIFRNYDVLRVCQAAKSADLSVRQFERRFCQQVGVAPKLFARIVRFHRALHAKLSHTERAWTDIAYEFGYFDQMHMVHDFRLFSGESPTRFFARYATMRIPWR
jgi:AraC-like DNA-binding protein